MWPDRVSNPGPLTYESGALATALRGPTLPLKVYPFKVYPFTLKALKNLASWFNQYILTFPAVSNRLKWNGFSSINTVAEKIVSQVSKNAVLLYVTTELQIKGVIEDNSKIFFP